MIPLRPDLAGGSIANLMHTLATACGAPPPPQPALHARYGLDARTLARARNIVLLVVDGLGVRQLEAHARGALRSEAGPRLTSVFPSTTAAAIPTFMTGLAPAQHALTGWHMWLEELQAIAAILPMMPRTGPPFSGAPSAIATRLFDHHPIYAGMHCPAWVVSPHDIAFSPFNAFHARGADTLAYTDLDSLMQTLAGLVHVPGRKYIHAYWPTLDSVAHRCGTDSRQARATLATFCTAFDALLKSIAGSETILLLTADHGFIDSPPQRTIDLADHPGLRALLARPLCGEQRVAWCYPKPGAEAEFVDRVRRDLGGAAELRSCRELVEEGWFGPLPAHPKLASRIGAFALVMQDNWTIREWLPGERQHTLLGVHGGVSADEMEVPLLSFFL